MSYSQKLKDPRWQRKRLEIMQRDEFKCSLCYDSESTLNVHHNYYIAGKQPWEYPDESFWTACDDCHKFMDETRVKLQELAGTLHPEVQNMLCVFLVSLHGITHGDKLCLLRSMRLTIDKAVSISEKKTRQDEMKYLKDLLDKLRNHREQVLK